LFQRRRKDGALFRGGWLSRVGTYHGKYGISMLSIRNIRYFNYKKSARNSRLHEPKIEPRLYWNWYSELKSIPRPIEVSCLSLLYLLLSFWNRTRKKMVKYHRKKIIIMCPRDGNEESWHETRESESLPLREYLHPSHEESSFFVVLGYSYIFRKHIIFHI